MLSLLLLLQAATPAAELPVAQPAENPAQWITSDDYPPTALNAGAGGTSGVRLVVGADGRPASCTVTLASGSPDLDTAACRALMRRARFVPVLDAGGRAVPSQLNRRIVWSVPTPPPAPEPIAIAGGFVLEVRWRYDAAGRPSGCDTHEEGSVSEALRGGPCTAAAPGATSPLVAPLAGRGGEIASRLELVLDAPEPLGALPPAAGATVLAQNRARIETYPDGRVRTCGDDPTGAPPLCIDLIRFRFPAAADNQPRIVRVRSLLLRQPSTP